MSSRNPAIELWRSRVPEGKCPGTGCPNMLPEGEGRVVCGRQECRDEYMEVFQRGRRGTITTLREFKVGPVKGLPFRVLLTFTPCGHTLELPRSKVSDKGKAWKRKRRRCEACARGEEPASEQDPVQTPKPA